MSVLLIVVALILGYACGRVRPLRRWRDKTWFRLTLGDLRTKKTQRITFLMLLTAFPLKTLKSACKSFAKRSEADRG